MDKKCVLVGVDNIPDALFMMDNLVRSLTNNNIKVVHRYFKNNKPEIETENIRIIYCPNNCRLEGVWADEIFGNYPLRWLDRKRDAYKAPYTGGLLDYVKEIENE